MASTSKKQIKPRKNSKEANKLDIFDGIFRLPDTILEHIFFSLPIEDAVALSAVSKTWRKVWTSLPVLEFSFQHDEDGILEDFITSINDSLSTLRNRLAIIDSFSLRLINPSQEEGLILNPHLNEWLSLVMKNYVKEIVVRASKSPNNVFYTIPESIFTSKSLVILKLIGCKFPANISFADEDKKSRFNEFNCLREIFLVNVVARDDQIKELVNHSRNFLEKLTIETSPAVELLSLEFFLKLNFVEVNVKTLHVNQAMKLETMVLYGVSRVYAFGVWNIRTLRCLTWDSNAYKSIQAFISSLPLLETIQLFLVHHQKIQIQSYNLENLVLCYGQWLEEPMEVELDTPRLSSIYFSGFSIPFITMFNRNKKLKLHYFGDLFGGIDGTQLHELGRFSQNLMQPMLEIHLYQIFIENLLTLEELKEHPIVYHPPNVRMLVLECIPVASDYSSFLNALLWSCHPKTLIVLMRTEETLKSPHRANFIHYLVDELVIKRGKNIPQCCTEYNKPKCWRHYIAEVKLYLYRSSHEFDEEAIDVPPQMAENGISIVDTTNKGVVVQFRFVWLPYPITW